MNRRALRLSPVLAAVVLAGCASVPPMACAAPWTRHAASRRPADSQKHVATSAPSQPPRHRIAQWLSQPVDADTAVRIALLRSPGLQAQLAQLARQDAQRAQALTLFNPTLTLGRFVNGHEREIERQLSLDLVQLITLPWRSRWQGWQLSRPRSPPPSRRCCTRGRHPPRLAAGRRPRSKACRPPERMHEAAAAGGELARRMALVGNFSKLEQAQELRVQHDAAAQLARARLNAALEREQLARLMGLWGPQADFALPDSLPPLPKAEALHTGADARSHRPARAPGRARPAP